MITAILAVVMAIIVVMGAYALITTGHYANRTPRERSFIIGFYFVLVIILILGYLGLLHKLWDTVFKI